MKRALLIINAKSGSAQQMLEADIAEQLHACGFDRVKLIELPDDKLPTLAEVERLDVNLVAILSGDGTISSLCSALSGWDGAILVLPGGTMNLLSRRLHGDLDAALVLEKMATAEFKAEPVPVILYDDREILTGLTAGPSTEWGKVREGMRQGNIADLAEKVPEAWSETVDGEGVQIKGVATGYPSIFVEPLSSEALKVTGFKAEGIKDMVAHGIAWLRGDFREGPKDDLGEQAEVTILGKANHLGLLIDGEGEDASSPLTCYAGLSSVKFLRAI